jgi:hypothetical protein
VRPNEAHDRRNVLALNPVNDLVRKWGIPDEITEAVHGIEFLTADVRERRFQSGKVRVDVAENRDSHD